MKRPLFAFARSSLLIAVLVALSLLAPTAQAERTLKATILHMNDVHGHYAPYREGDAEHYVGGYGKAATLIEKIRTENRHQGRETYVLMAGDLLTGTPLDAATKGTLGVKLMNSMGFTAMVVGNHEFDLGWSQLFNTLAPMMKFPLLSANMKTSACPPPPIKGAIELPTTADTKVLVFGLTTKDAKTKTKASNVEGTEFLDEEGTAAAILKKYSDEDFVVALTHIGIDEDKKLAQSSPKIDVIVGGHSHTRLTSPYRGNPNEAVIVQAGACARYLGRLDVEVVNGRVTAYSGELIPLDGNIPEDPKIAQMIDQAKAALPDTYGKVIGRTEISLVGGCRTDVPGAKARLDKLVTYLIAESAGTPALINSGTVRASLNKGEITVADVETALPFKGSVPVTVQLTGTELAQVLQMSVDQGEYGARLQTIGITYGVENGKVTVDRVGDVAFDPDKTYRVTINDFLATGGDGYVIFKDKPAEKGPKLVKDLLIDFIKTNSVITAELINGIR